MCTSIACGKHATKDNLVLIARNEDYPVNNWNKHMKFHKTPPYTKAQEQWILGNGLKTGTPKNSFSYCSMPDADGDACGTGGSYLFEARGINEKDVAITATNSLQTNDKAKKADPFVLSPGIEESVIATLLLPQAESARHAVRLLGEYVTKYGAAEANGVLMADENEVWYMEIGSARHWIAVKIPDDNYLVVANSMRIHGVDLTDQEHVLASEGLYDFVTEHKLLENPDRTEFDFATAFGQQGKAESGETDPYYNIDRIWLAQSMLSPSNKPEIRHQELYELFMKPDQPVTPAHVMEVLRSTFKGTPLEHEPDATRPIGVVRTLQSHIMTLDSRFPDGLRGVIWQAMGSPLCSIYVPFYALADEIPETYSCGGSDSFSSDSIWWTWRSLFALASRIDALDNLSDYCKTWETYFIRSHETMNEILKQHSSIDLSDAQLMAKAYSKNNLSLTADLAVKKYQSLMAALTAAQKDQ